jgi:hypothetical protein
MLTSQSSEERHNSDPGPIEVTGWLLLRGTQYLRQSSIHSSFIHRRSPFPLLQLHSSNKRLSLHAPCVTIMDRCLNSQGFSDSFPNLARRFVLENLALNEKDPKLRERDIPTLLRKAEEYRRPKSPVEKLMEWQQKHAANEEDAQQAHKLFHHAVQQRARREMVLRQHNQVTQVSIAAPLLASNAPWSLPRPPATPLSVYQRSQQPK